MKINKMIVFVLLALPFVFACSSNGRGVARAELCPVDYNPMDPLDNAQSKVYSGKVNIKPRENFADAGEYKYDDSQIYYSNPSLDLKVHFIQNKNRAGVYSLAIKCIGGHGYNALTEPVNVEIPVLTNVKVTAQRTEVTTRTITFQILPPLPSGQAGKRLIFDMTKVDTAYESKSPTDFYQNYPSVNQYFMTLKNHSDQHELIAHIKSRASTKKNDDKSKANDPGEFEIRTLVSLTKAP